MKKKSEIICQCPECAAPLEEEWLISTGARLMGRRRQTQTPSPDAVKKMQEVLKKNRAKRWLKAETN